MCIHIESALSRCINICIGIRAKLNFSQELCFKVSLTPPPAS